MNILQIIGIAELAEQEFADFAAGKPISHSQKIGNVELDVTVVKLPNGPTPDYQVFTGSFFQILLLVLADATALTSGAPIKVAEKIGQEWYGQTFAVKVEAAS